LIWPYAVAPAIAGTLGLFLLNPTSGYVAHILNNGFGLGWDPTLKPWHGMAFVVIASVWKQVSYNFIFFFAGLQAIPKSLIDASVMDGATPFFRFRTIVFPLLAPMTFFLVVMNTIYAFFDTFGTIASTTDGGPQAFTKTLVYKVYEDGFVGNDLGGSSAQSVILMVIVIALTVAQFKYVERRINYGV
jgi:sn-glycerol 3-phosphate transport system permease protein